MADAHAPVLGLTIPQRALYFDVLTIDQMLELATTADSAGLFDSVWVGDSIMAKPRPESLTLLGALAAVTHQVRLGVGCMASFPIRHPVLFAYQWANLDIISKGRTILAVCTGLLKQGGASEKEGAPFGVPDRERAARMEEYIDVCRALWSKTDVVFDGRFLQLDGVTIEPRPAQDPCPIWIASNPMGGANRERMLERVARLGDGWMSVRFTPEMFQENWAVLRRLLADQGRDPDAFPTMAYHNLNVNEDREEALDESFRFLEAYYGPTFTPEMVAAWTVAGNPRACAQQLRALAEEGAKTVTLRLTAWDQFKQLDRLMNEVVPALGA